MHFFSLAKLGLSLYNFNILDFDPKFKVLSQSRQIVYSYLLFVTNNMHISEARLFRSHFRKLEISSTIQTFAVLNLVSQVQCEIDKHQRVQIRQIFWKIDFESNCQKWTALLDIELPPEYFILEKFRKPMTRAKGHVSVITKIISARELRYQRGRS